MMQEMLAPSVVSWSAAISACEKGKRWEDARNMLQGMAHHAVPTDTISRNASITACEQGQ